MTKTTSPNRIERVIVGIDPDLTKSGVAVVLSGALDELKGLSFPALLRFCESLVAGGAVFVVEDVEHDKTTYRRSKTSVASHARIAQNVGQVKGVARIMVECLHDMGAEVVKIKPLTGPIKRAKKDAEYFNRLTGWSGRSNQDQRDAALLAIHYSKTLCARAI